MFNDDLWAGTDASLVRVKEVNTELESRSKKDEGDEDGGFKVPSLLEVNGSVGRIKVSGPLVNSDNIFYALFGITTYSRIREALVEAAADKDVKSILLDMNTPGGAVSGMYDTGELIKAIDRHVKPVMAYADGMVASAGYWLAASARRIFVSPTSQVGSIGVITHTMDLTKAMDEDGVKVNVIRAGRYKQAGNPYEVLTDDMRAEIQSQVDAAYRVFVQHVAQQRGRTYEYVDTVMAQGRVFIGESAYQTGLVDGFGSFDEAFSLIASKAFDNFPKSIENTPKASNIEDIPMPTKTPLVSALQAALVEAGVATEAVEVEITDPAPAATEVEAAVTVPDEGAGVAAEAEMTAQDIEQLVSHAADLEARVTELTEQLQTRTDELSAMTKTLATAQVTNEGMTEIVGRAVNTMRVALGGSATDMSGLSATEVLTLHKVTSADFKKNFKAGGVAGVDSAPEATTNQEVINDSLRAARLAATRF